MKSIKKMKMTFGNLLRWRHWPSVKKKNFLLNVFWGLVIAIVIQFVQGTGIVQGMLDKAYDSHVVKDFKSANDKKESVSDKIFMLLFDKTAYTTPNADGLNTLGVWTPRKKLGETVEKTIKLGAKVVVVDFDLQRPVPLICVNGNCVNENREYLSQLEKAAELLRKKDAVMILPFAELKPEAGDYLKAYQALLKKNSDVIKQGIATVYKNMSDCKVRHFRFYKKLENKEVIFSIPVLAAVFQWHGRKNGHRVLNKAREKLNSKSAVFIPSHNRKRGIWLYATNRYGQCLEARFKFRMLTEDAINKLGGGLNLSIAKPQYQVFDPYFDAQQIRGKTVLIGSVYEQSGDIHNTPVGKLPGVFLIANALNIFYKGDQIHAPHFVLNYLILFLWIVIASMLFTHLPGKWSALFLTGLIILIFSPLSAWLFAKRGIFMDFWLPATIMGFRGRIAELEAYLEDRFKKKGGEK